jgi:hypothetical protein
MLQQLVQPRLVACLSSLLSSGADVHVLHSKLGLLLQAPAHDPRQQQQQQQQQAAAAAAALRAQVVVVLRLLQGFVPTWQPDLVAAAWQRIVRWALGAAAQHPGVLVLVAAPAGDASPQEGGGAAALKELQAACAVGTAACWAALAPLHGAQAAGMLSEVNRLALCAHPITALLARQLLVDLVSLHAGCAELAVQEMTLMHGVLAAAAALAAVPGSDSSAGCGQQQRGVLQAAADTLAALLQACDEATAAGWASQHLLDGSGSGGWLDAGACSLLTAECGLLLRARGGAPLPVPQGQLQGLWEQLLTTGQQVRHLCWGVVTQSLGLKPAALTATAAPPCLTCACRCSSCWTCAS